METERLKIFIDITKRKSSPTKSEGSMPLSKRKSSCPLSNEFLSSPPNKDGIEFIENSSQKQVRVISREIILPQPSVGS